MKKLDWVESGTSGRLMAIGLSRFFEIREDSLRNDKPIYALTSPPYATEFVATIEDAKNIAQQRNNRDIERMQHELDFWVKE